MSTAQKTERLRVHAFALVEPGMDSINPARCRRWASARPSAC